MSKIKWMLMGMTAAFLGGCASDGSPGDVQVSSPSATTYPAVPVNACRVSSYPPKGQYVVIAQLTATGQVKILDLGLVRTTSDSSKLTDKIDRAIDMVWLELRGEKFPSRHEPIQAGPRGGIAGQRLGNGAYAA